MRVFTQVDLTELRGLREREEFFWLDLEDPDDATLDDVGELLQLHELAREDTREFGQRPKVDVYEDQVLVVYYGAGLDQIGGPSPVEMHLHISPAFILSVHRRGCQRVEVVQRAVQLDPPKNEQVLVYRVIDGLTDSILDVLDRTNDRIDDYEAQLFDQPRARDRDAMAQLRRTLGIFRRTMIAQRQMLPRALEVLEERGLSAPKMGSYYRDVADHMWRAVEEVEAARDSLQGMLETYSNEVQERLTIVATIFLPLSVLTGFFGMNFNWVINHLGSPWAFLGLGVGGLIAAACLIVWWMMRSGLYQGPNRPPFVRRLKPEAARPASDAPPPR